MSQNSITVTQDTIVKMTIKQGVEEDRISSTYGKFDTGELAFTRDTKRIFVGDCNMNEESNVETVGGSISGNKYLGMVDSKRSLSAQDNGIPLNYETYTTYENGAKNENPILTKDSLYRVTTNKKWSTKAYYNETTDAYDGDYLYDVYTNSIVFFDHRITTDTNKQPTGLDNGGVVIEEGVEGKRKTKIENYIVATSNTENSESKTQSVETYGNGYVVFRNIIPDNQTIRFVNREFKKENGEPSETKGTYSHNILEVFDIPASKMTGSFDKNVFATGGKVISLQESIPLNEITTKSNGTNLTLPNTINFKNKSTSNTITYSFSTEEGTNSPTEYKLHVDKNGDNNYSISVVESIVDDDETIIYLGDGLEAVSDNDKNSYLVVGDAGVKLSLKSSINNINGGYYKDPFYTETKDSTLYIENAGYEGGILSIFNNYTTYYKGSFDENNKQVKDYVNKFQNNNSSLNLFKEPFFLAWTGVSGAYNDAFSANLQGTIYKFPHISKKVLWGGSSSSLSGDSLTKSLVVVGWNSSNASYSSVLAIDNYPNQGDVWELDSNNSYERQMYTYPLSLKNGNTNYISSFDNTSTFSDFKSLLALNDDGAPIINEPIFTIANEASDGSGSYSLVTSLPYSFENFSKESDVYEKIVFSSSITNIKKVYLDSDLLFDSENNDLTNDGGCFYKVKSGNKLIGFLATGHSKLFKIDKDHPEKPVKRTITIYYDNSGTLEQYIIDLNPSNYWEDFVFYKKDTKFYLEVPELDDSYKIKKSVTNKIEEIATSNNNLKMNQYNDNGEKITDTKEVTNADYEREEYIKNSGWYICKLKRSFYTAINREAVGFDISSTTYSLVTDSFSDELIESTESYKIVLQTPKVKFAHTIDQPPSSTLNDEAKNYRIPHTASSILIEMTNETDNPIYIVTSNKFSNLKEFDEAVDANSGVFWTGGSVTTPPTLEVNNLYWNSLNSYEKSLKNLPANSREIVEVPLIDTINGTKDFFLRISNITGASSPSFAMRVVGYRT